MKKTYIIPVVSVLYIRVTQMMATSSIRIKVSDTEYDGAGRVKENLPQTESIWDKDWNYEN